MRISDGSSDVCSSDLHPLGERPRFGGWQLQRRGDRDVAAEQAALPRRTLVRRTIGAGEQAFGAGESARAVGLDTIERPARREGLDLPAVQHLGVDTARKIVERDEIALGALGDERLHRLFADALERAERIADRESLIAAPDREIST